MGRVECFTITGVECWFWSQDHRPPHFHAKKAGQWHYRVWFMNKEGCMLERAEGPKGRISASDRKLLQEAAVRHRAKLLRQWEKKVKYGD